RSRAGRTSRARAGIGCQCGVGLAAQFLLGYSPALRLVGRECDEREVAACGFGAVAGHKAGPGLDVPLALTHVWASTRRNIFVATFIALLAAAVAMECSSNGSSDESRSARASATADMNMSASWCDSAS